MLPGKSAAKGRNIAGYEVDMEVIRAIRKAAGDEYVLMHDPVERYTRSAALQVGRLLDRLNFLWFEDPIPTADIGGLAQLCRALDLQVHVGEFISHRMISLNTSWRKRSRWCALLRTT